MSPSVPLFERLARLEIDGVDEAWAVVSLDWASVVGQPDVVELAVSPHRRRDYYALTDEVVAQAATLYWTVQNEEVPFHFFVFEAHSRPGGLVLRLCAVEAVLEQGCDYRAFVGQKPLEIAQSVLSELGVTLDSRCQESYATLPQCVQHQESYFTFLRRILSAAGVAWLSTPERPFTVTVSDSITLLGDLDGPAFDVQDAAGLSRDSEHVLFDVQLLTKETTDSVALRDYHFLAPSLDLSAEQSSNKTDLLAYEYRAGYENPAVGRRLAKQRLEARRRERVVLAARSTHRGLRPGYVLEVSGLPDGAAARWLIVETTLRLAPRSSAEDLAYWTELRAVPADTGYRANPEPPVRTSGMETTTVTGPAGSEIHPDEYGRITAQFRWDRRNAQDDTASSYWRVAHPPTSGGFLLPRVGWEQLTSFWEGELDSPVILGRLYEGKAQPPSSLPGKKTSTAFGTATTPSGGGGNCLSFDDTAGAEGMSFVASKDFNERTEKDKVTSITANETTTIAANRSVVVGKDHLMDIAAGQTWTIGATHEQSVASNEVISAGSETIVVGGARLFDVTGSHATDAGALVRVVGGVKTVACIEGDTVKVKGASARSVSGAWMQSAAMGVGVQVEGANLLQVGGLRSVNCVNFEVSAKALKEVHASHSEESGSDWVWKGKGGAKFKSGGPGKLKGEDVVFEATNKIEIKAGGVKLTITGSKVVIKGNFKSSQASADSADESYD